MNLLMPLLWNSFPRRWFVFTHYGCYFVFRCWKINSFFIPCNCVLQKRLFSISVVCQMHEGVSFLMNFMIVGYCGNQHVQAICLELAMCIFCVLNPLVVNKAVHVTSAVSSFWAVLVSVMCHLSLSRTSAHHIFSLLHWVNWLKW
jgi:hypothetical protein